MLQPTDRYPLHIQKLILKAERDGVDPASVILLAPDYTIGQYTEYVMRTFGMLLAAIKE